ncbi:MAG: MOSC domain-containing protein [Candidatus Krumholzibacteriia bacterium]
MTGSAVTEGAVVALCISDAKGTVKHPVPEASLRAEHGIVGDAHASSWPRQVSLLAAESIERMRRVLPDLAHGAFAENVVTAGVDLARLAVGDRLRLGAEVVLEVTQIGKECHHGCAIRQQVGDCIMPREGIFCRVRMGGRLQVGDPIRVETAGSAASQGKG